MVIQLYRYMFNFFGPLFPQSMGKLAVKRFCTPASRIKVKADEHALLCRAQSLRWRINGIKMQGYLWVDESSFTQKPMVLCVHGFGSRTAKMSVQIENLIERGFDVVSFDARGHGESGGKSLSVPDYKADLIKIMRRLENNGFRLSGFIGHSMGAIAGLYAINQIDNSRSFISDNFKGILIGAPSKIVRVISGFAQYFNLPKKVEESMYHVLSESENLPITSYDLGYYIENSPYDVCLVHDKKDKEMPFEYAEKIAQDTQCSIKVTDGLGHRRIMKDIGLANDIIDILAGNNYQKTTELS